MKKNLLKLIFTITLIISPIFSTCDPKTCQYCCIEVNGVSTCKDEIIECRLQNERDYFPFIILICIVSFWCFAMPTCLGCCKVFLVGKFCFGYTIIGGIEMFIKKVIKKGTRKKYDIRKRKTSEQNFNTIRNQVMKGRVKEGAKGSNSSDRSMRLMSKKTYTWKKDDLLAK